MRIAHVGRDELGVSEGVHGGAGHLLIKGLWSEDDFQTPWFFVHFAILPPGGGIGHHRHDECEEMFTILDNAAQFTHNGRTAEVVGGATVPCRKGESHAIYNHTDRETRFMNFCVANTGGGYDCTDFRENRVGAPLEAVDRLPVGRLDRNLLTFIPNVHEGKGKDRDKTGLGASGFPNKLGIRRSLRGPARRIGWLSPARRDRGDLYHHGGQRSNDGGR